MTADSVPSRVAAGAAWLDEHRPGWEGSIDLGTLDLDDACRCVLGQVMPERYYYRTLARLHGSGHMATETWSVRHGFLGTSEDEVTALDEAWISLIKERYDSGLLSGGEA